jgi:hypothetical protein
MRNLNNKDLFKIMRILRKANIKEDLLKMKMPKNATDQESGMMLLLQFMESAPNAEKEIFEFLADVGGVEVENLENDEFDLLPDIIQHLTKQEKLVNFLSQAFKSMN